MRNEGLSQVIRYEQQIKSKIQKIENVILQGGRNEYSRKQLNQLIQDEQILLKYLQVESSKMTNQVRTLYNKNLTRWRKKIKQHKQYFYTYFRVNAPKQDNYNIRAALEIQKQNNELFDRKMKMYENEHVQSNIGHQIRQQGQIIQRGIQNNQQMRRQADGASDAIKVIQASILKRKCMFYSIFVLFSMAVVFIIIHKLTK